MANQINITPASQVATVEVNNRELSVNVQNSIKTVDVSIEARSNIAIDITRSIAYTGVQQIIAGDNIVVTPNGGTGIVTITGTGDAATANYANFAGEAFNVSGSNVTGPVANALTTQNIQGSPSSTDVWTTDSSMGLFSYSGVSKITGINELRIATQFLGPPNQGTYIWVFDQTGNITLPGNTFSFKYANGAQVQLDGPVGNANYANFAGTAFNVSGSNVSGQVANANYSTYSNIANIAKSVAGANVSGEVANANFASYSGIANISNVAYSVNVANVVGIGNIATVNLNSNPDQYLNGQGEWQTINTGVPNYANFAGNALNVNGSNVSGAVALANEAYSVSGANVSGAVANANHATVSDSANTVAGANVTGYVEFASEANVAVYATTANSVAVANVVGIGNIAVVNLYGDPDYALFGDGVWKAVATGTPNYANFAGTAFTANSVAGANVSGEVANAEYARFAGNANIANTAISVAGANVTGTVANATYAVTAGSADSVAGSDVIGQVSNSLVAGTVYTNAQPNITSVGTLAGLQVSGDITPTSNISYDLGNATNRFRDIYLSGTTIYLGNANLSSSGNSIVTYGSNVNGDLNVTGNATINGNLSVTGNLTYIDIVDLRVQDPIIELGGGPNGTPLTTNDGMDRGTILQYFTTTPVSAYMGWKNSAGEFQFGSDVSTTNNIVTVNTLGNVRANVFIGNLDGVATFATTANSVAGANVSGEVANATYAITSGTADSVAGANVSGTVANATYAITAGTAYSVSAANITGTVNLANYATVANSVAGANVSGAVGLATYATTANAVAGANVSGAVGLATYATTANAVAGANVSGAVAFATTANSVAVANVVGIGNIATTNYNGNGSQILAGNGAWINTPNTASANYANFAGEAFNVSGSNVTGAVGLATFATTANAVAGANVSGAVSFATTANAVAGANVSGAVSFATTANAVAGANVSGAVNLATYATTANAVAGANVSGAVAFATTANSVAGANVTGAVSLATFATTANAVAGANVSGEVSFAATANSVAGANVSGAVAYATTANSVAGANVSGAVAYATTANSVAGANVSGAVAYATTANSVAVANVSGIGNIAVINLTGSSSNVLYGNGVFAAAGGGGGGTPGGANTQLQFNNDGAFGGISTVTWNGSNISLGAVGNVKITGGSNNYILATDGTGNLSFSAKTNNLTIGTRTVSVNIPITDYTMNVQGRTGNITVNVN